MGDAFDDVCGDWVMVGRRLGGVLVVCGLRLGDVSFFLLQQNALKKHRHGYTLKNTRCVCRHGCPMEGDLSTYIYIYIYIYLNK